MFHSKKSLTLRWETNPRTYDSQVNVLDDYEIPSRCRKRKKRVPTYHLLPCIQEDAKADKYGEVGNWPVLLIE